MSHPAKFAAVLPGGEPAALARVRVVLVRPQHPGNIGAAARAMKTMGLMDLRLVQPRQFPAAEATARASGADDVLAQARIHDSLSEALAGSRLVLGASARLRELPWQEITVREAGLLAAGAATSGEAALVFGAERMGLSNEELALCQRQMVIPANPQYASLNLAAAVQLVCYELRMALLGTVEFGTSTEDPATTEEVELLVQHVERSMLRVGFLDPKQPGMLLLRLRRLLARARLERPEMQILRGWLRAVDQALDRQSRHAA
jgi:TrmH family RNA methyltransferase